MKTHFRRTTWDSTAQPKRMSLDKLLYEIRRADGGDNLLLDSVTMQDILEDVESILAFDALVTPYAKLERKMTILKTVMERAGLTIQPLAVQISDPFKQNNTAQVAVIFELSDGQTVSIFFHNPDIDPRKIQQSDELVSWKWLLNKKDITIVVAPERGEDLNVHDVAMRIMKLAEKNSQAFQRANVNRAAKMQAIEDIKTEIVSLEQELKDVQHELEVAKVEDEINLIIVEVYDNDGNRHPELEDGYAQEDHEPEAENTHVQVTKDSNTVVAQEIEDSGVLDQPVVLTTTESHDHPMKSAFEAELNALQLETDIETYLNKLEAIAERVEKAGLLEELDGILNVTADKLTDMLADAEKGISFDTAFDDANKKLIEQKSEDTQFLQMVLDSSVDMFDRELPDKIEVIYIRNRSDGDVINLAKRAIDAYANVMMQSAVNNSEENAIICG
jgi:hypothetical protein